MVQPHDFLINHKRERLSKAGELIPELREAISEMPSTQATFSFPELDIDNRKFQEVHCEFVRAWPVWEGMSRRRRREFVNPGYAHAEHFTDVVVDCDCDNSFAHTNDGPWTKLQNEHQHGDDCQIYDRLRARADLAEQRHKLFDRLIWLGWNAKEMGRRFGVGQNSVTSMASRLGFTLTERRDEYREAVAKTYVMLVREYGVPSKDVVEIYDHTRSTINRWVNKFDIQAENAEMYRDEGGMWQWEQNA